MQSANFGVKNQEWIPAGQARKPARANWLPRSLGAIATVVVHVMLATPIVLGVAENKKRTPESDGTVASASQGEQFERMILLDLSSIASSESEALLIDSEGIAPELFELLLVSSSPESPPELKQEEFEQDESASEAAGDPAGNAALFGRYMGQVTARIERAWMRPRSPVEGGYFECRVRITQDRRGIVESIELQRCGSDGRWQTSLISAIQRASPLSAPPEPWLFTPTLTLSFTGQQYVALQTPEHDYEPATARVAMTSSPPPLFRNADEEESEPAVFDGTGDIELTITGSEVRWTKKD